MNSRSPIDSSLIFHDELFRTRDPVRVLPQETFIQALSSSVSPHHIAFQAQLASLGELQSYQALLFTRK